MRPFTVQLKAFIFKPSLASSLVTLLILPLLVYLGVWQLSRWEEKKILQQTVEQRLLAAPRPFSQPVINDIPRFSRITVTGSFLNDHQILLDNQMYKGQAGYHVYTPFLPTGETKLLLINRGWIPLGSTRKDLPKIAPVVGTVTLTGIINQPTSGLQLDNPTPKPAITWPFVAQSIDFAALSSLLNRACFPFILQLTEENPTVGFIPAPISQGISANRHLGYAVQWFTMAVVAGFYYLVINSRRKSSDITA